MKAWLKVLGLGCIVGSSAVACSVTFGNPDDDEVGGGNTGATGNAPSGGRDNEGGDTSGGRSTGGTTSGGASNAGASSGGASDAGASSGGASNGGASDGGATNGGATNGGASSGGASSGGGTTDGGAATGGGGGFTGESCLECLDRVCADEFAACRATDDLISVDDDGVPVSEPSGSPDCVEEFVAFQRCFEVAWVNECRDYREADCGESAALVDYGGDPLAETNALANCTLDVDASGNDCIDACVNFAAFGAADTCG